MGKQRIALPYFGSIEMEYYDESDTNFKYDYSEYECPFQGRLIDLDINFTDLAEENILLVKQALENMNEISSKAEYFLKTDFHSGKVVKSYIDEWKEYHLHEDIFSGLAKKVSGDNARNELLNELQLVRAGFYAFDSEQSFIVADFAFGYEMDSGYRDNMVVIELDKNLRLENITTEG